MLHFSKGLFVALFHFFKGLFAVLFHFSKGLSSAKVIKIMKKVPILIDFLCQFSAFL